MLKRFAYETLKPCCAASTEQTPYVCITCCCLVAFLPQFEPLLGCCTQLQLLLALLTSLKHTAFAQDLSN